MQRKYDGLWRLLPQWAQRLALRLDGVRIGLASRLAHADRFEAYYRARVPDLHLAPNHANRDLYWTGTCPVCRDRAIWASPSTGFWACAGFCSGRGQVKSPEQLEYLLNGEDCAENVQRLMDQAA